MVNNWDRLLFYSSQNRCLNLTPAVSHLKPPALFTSLSCCASVAVQKQDTETGISDITAFPLALSDAYLMRDRRRLGALVNMWHALVCCAGGSPACVHGRWLSVGKRELVWEMGLCLKCTVDGLLLDEGGRPLTPPTLLFIVPFFNVAFCFW